LKKKIQKDFKLCEKKNKKKTKDKKLKKKKKNSTVQTSAANVIS